MKMMHRLLPVSLFYAGFAFVLLVAQEPAPPPLPPGPLIQKHAPDFAKWTVTIREGDLDSPPPTPGLATAPGTTGPTPPQVMTFTKTGHLLDVTMPMAGKNWNVWNVGSIKTLVDPDEKSCGPVVPSSPDHPNPFDIDLTKSDFAGLDWISMDNYQGIKTFLDKKCILFKTANKEAYIDFETRLPVGLQAADGAHIFQFQPAPADMLPLPKIVQSYLDQRKKEEARYTRVPLAPF